MLQQESKRKLLAQKLSKLAEPKKRLKSLKNNSKNFNPILKRNQSITIKLAQQVVSKRLKKLTKTLTT